MSLWQDKQYINRISYRLERFSWKKEDLATFRCPICGDSKRNLFKTRGYFFINKKRAWMFTCHNCNASLSVGSFLQRIDPMLYNEYRLELYKQAPVVHKETKIEHAYKELNKNVLDLPKIIDLSADHPARMYIENRKLPVEFMKEIYFSDDFKGFADRVQVRNDYKLPRNEQRIVIPFLTKTGLIAVQGRSMIPDHPLKYITIKVDKDAPKIYGLDRFDKNKPGYILEGPFDSMFLPNALAAGSGSLQEIQKYVNLENVTFVGDNQPRNLAVIKELNRLVESNVRVFIWPDALNMKDINDLAMSGRSLNQIKELVDSNTFTGLEAKFRLQKWKRC